MALCCMSHSPLLNLPGPSRDLLDDINAALRRRPRLRPRLRPRARRHLLPGPLQRVLLPDDAAVLHRHRRRPGSATTARRPVRSTFPRTSPPAWRKRCSHAGVDVAISASMDVDHGTVQPLQTLFGDAAARPVIPIFINSVATPLGPLRRSQGAGHGGRRLSGHAGQAGAGRRFRWAVPRSAGADPGDRPTRRTRPDRARRADVNGAAPSPSGRGDGCRAQLRARREHVATAEPGLGSPLPGHRRQRPPLRCRRLVQRHGSPTRRATPHMRSAPGWRPSPPWRRRALTGPATATTGRLPN